MQRITETIPAVLEAGTYKPRRLFDQAPCSHTPPHSTANILKTKKLPQPTLTKTPSYGRGNSITTKYFGHIKWKLHSKGVLNTVVSTTVY